MRFCQIDLGEMNILCYNEGMKTNKLLIIDLESTCWNDRPREYATENAEIIEIGVTLYSTKDKRILENKSYLVKPQCTEVSDFCTELTTITPEMLEKEASLADVLKQISKDYKLKELTWGSWGFYDYNQLRRECRRKNIRNPFGERNYINIKKMVALNNGWSKEKGIGNALEAIGLEFEGTAHRGIDDTKNIARILAHS